jgi:hypothetical protein
MSSIDGEGVTFQQGEKAEFFIVRIAFDCQGLLPFFSS